MIIKRSASGAGPRVERLFRTEFDVKLSRRIIEGRAVPYGVAEVVSDDGVEWYREEWALGAFTRHATEPALTGRVKLNYTHDDTRLMNWLGRTLHLEERPDGLYGEWKVDATDVGDLALFKVGDGQLRGLSVAARFVESRKIGDVTVRTRAMLDHVALCEQGAFSTAEVLAVRQRPPAAPQPNQWADALAKLRAARTDVLKTR